MSSAEFCPVARLEKLLVATDRSAFSEAAVTEAINFAKKCSTRLYVFSVIEANPEYETIGADFFQKEEEEARSDLEAIKQMAAQQGVECETILRKGEEPYRLIVDEAAGKKVDMIIIGRHGRTGLLKFLMGKVAANVIGHAPCKVLVVPKAARIEYQKMLVATDGSDHSIEAASEAIGIVKRTGSSILVVSAAGSELDLNEAKSNVAKIVEMAQKEGIQVKETLTPVGRPYDVIVETAGGRGVDLIVMGTYGKTGVKQLLMGSTTEKVIGSAGCAVLVAKRA
jgi:nucleotide-binding universal stress UspA family protein